jgi:hypothetical protein
LGATPVALPTVEDYAAQTVILQPSPTQLPGGRANFGIGASLTESKIYVMGGIDDTGADTTTVLELDVLTNGLVPGNLGTPSGVWNVQGNLSIARHGLAVSTPPGVRNLITQNAGRSQNLDSFVIWMFLKVKSYSAPINASDPAAFRGRALFGQVGLLQPGVSCATCHGGPRWTRSTVDFGSPAPASQVSGLEIFKTATQPLGSEASVTVRVGTFLSTRNNERRPDPADPSNVISPLGAEGFNIPSMLSLCGTAPYFYSGLAPTLTNVLDGSTDGNGGTRYHFVSDPSQRADLVQFLNSIDATTPTFP